VIDADARCFLNSLGQAHGELAFLLHGSSNTYIAADDRHDVLVVFKYGLVGFRALLGAEASQGANLQHRETLLAD
jgi:hypothetical protein